MRSIRDMGVERCWIKSRTIFASEAFLNLCAEGQGGSLEGFNLALANLNPERDPPCPEAHNF